MATAKEENITPDRTIIRLPRRVLETGQPFLEHYLPAYNFRETEHGTEYKRDPDFPTLPELWSRPDPDNDERFDDAGETPD